MRLPHPSVTQRRTPAGHLRSRGHTHTTDTHSAAHMTGHQLPVSLFLSFFTSFFKEIPPFPDPSSKQENKRTKSASVHLQALQGAGCLPSVFPFPILSSFLVCLKSLSCRCRSKSHYRQQLVLGLGRPAGKHCTALDLTAGEKSKSEEKIQTEERTKSGR